MFYKWNKSPANLCAMYFVQKNLRLTLCVPIPGGDNLFKRVVSKGPFTMKAVEAAFSAYSPLLTSVTWPGETLATVVNVPRPPSAYSQLQLAISWPSAVAVDSCEKWS